MAPTKKRARSPSLAEDDECHYTVKTWIVTDPDARPAASKTHEREKSASRRVEVQKCPFAPQGMFKTGTNMDLRYALPNAQWHGMSRYNSFVLHHTKFCCDEFVFVANEKSIERQKCEGDEAADEDARGEWVARILEIRASDAYHVYARVYWMYWPHDLPDKLYLDGNLVRGRQPYHGHHELIATNHMDIINVVSVSRCADVSQWTESDNEDVRTSVFCWRQAFDILTSQLSTVQVTCRCQTPANPDDTMVRCTSDKCGKWLHQTCLRDDVLLRVYIKLGADLPYEGSTPKDEKNRGIARFLSPSEGSDGVVMESTIDVYTDVVNAKSPVGLMETPKKDPPVSVDGEGLSVATPSNPKKKKRAKAKIYHGLFEGTSVKASTVWRITDLRDVPGGPKSWTENSTCLYCGSIIQ